MKVHLFKEINAWTHAIIKTSNIPSTGILPGSLGTCFPRIGSEPAARVCFLKLLIGLLEHFPDLVERNRLPVFR